MAKAKLSRPMTAASSFATPRRVRFSSRITQTRSNSFEWMRSMQTAGRERRGGCGPREIGGFMTVTTPHHLRAGKAEGQREVPPEAAAAGVGPSSSANKGSQRQEVIRPPIENIPGMYFISVLSRKLRTCHVSARRNKAAFPAPPE